MTTTAGTLSHQAVSGAAVLTVTDGKWPMMLKVERLTGGEQGVRNSDSSHPLGGARPAGEWNRLRDGPHYPSVPPAMDGPDELPPPRPGASAAPLTAQKTAVSAEAALAVAWGGCLCGHLRPVRHPRGIRNASRRRHPRPAGGGTGTDSEHVGSLLRLGWFSVADHR